MAGGEVRAGRPVGQHAGAEELSTGRFARESHRHDSDYWIAAWDLRERIRRRRDTRRWHPDAIFDRDTGERIDLHVASPVHPRRAAGHDGEPAPRGGERLIQSWPGTHPAAHHRGAAGPYLNGASWHRHLQGDRRARGPAGPARALPGQQRERPPRARRHLRDPQLLVRHAWAVEHNLVVSPRYYSRTTSRAQNLCPGCPVGAPAERP